jgi:hypothetical protein
MIKLIDYTRNNEEVTHFFEDKKNVNANFAYSRYEDMKEDLKNFDRDKNDINENTFISSDDFRCGVIDKIGEDWEITNEWEIKGAETRKRKD